MKLKQLARMLLPARVYSRISLYREQRRRYGFVPYTVTRRFGEWKLIIHIRDAIARGWYDRDWQLPREIEVLRASGALKAGAMVFDIGAHQAVVAMMLAKTVGPKGRVIAVEATQHNVDVGKLNISANGMANVTLLHAAGAEYVGEIRFSPRENGHVAVADEAGIVIAATSIDALAAEFGAPDVLFVDVEGYELHVIRGAQRAIREHRPALFIEVHVGNGLEQFGTIEDLLTLVPQDYEILVAQTESDEYRSLADNRHCMNRHCRVVAIPRP